MTTPDPIRRAGGEPPPSNPGEAPPVPAESGPLDALPSLVLLARMQQGETAARDELMRRYWPRLHRWARGRLPVGARDLYETADLVQETMVAALGRLEDFEPEYDGALIAYLRTAVLNRVRSLARGAGRRGERVELRDDLVHPDPSPLEEVIGRDALERYERALSRLRAEDRDAIHLKIELDLPYEQITTTLGKPTITATRMAVSRALARLAREMQRDA
jgi:RNA polymerase sigma-70 factor (ECF subfamily)